MKGQPIKIAILAMGGEGGGVLADWIVDLGEHNGYFAQATSVPGVAQRTGATIYYVELFPREQADALPILALMPLAGDVDVVLASELMEAGRAVQRGFVTRERTTLIASTHRVYSIAEKTAMGDGRVDSEVLLAAAKRAAKSFIHFDMAEAAESGGSVISAVLFGALAGSGVLPFSRKQFEKTIERGGVGVKPSLRVFDLAFTRSTSGEDAKQSVEQVETALNARNESVRRLLTRITTEFPEYAQTVIVEGVRRLLDYQDCAYAELYLERLSTVRTASMAGDSELIREVGRHLALWMSYEDTIRVADLKTRAARFERVRTEVRATDDQLVGVSEFIHPRIEEICETLPVSLGRWLSKPNWAHRIVKRYTQDGRTIRTSSLRGFTLLYAVARLRVIRRRTLRYELENARIERWIDQIISSARHNPALAVEVVQCQRLVKGYGDTHARGLRNYETLMATVVRKGAHLAPATLRELRDAALGDEYGNKLREAMARYELTADA
jgi:indolepyruvate ferredoxin oxidoreductase beta subunit